MMTMLLCWWTLFAAGLSFTFLISTCVLLDAKKRPQHTEQVVAQMQSLLDAPAFSVVLLSACLVVFVPLQDIENRIN